MKNKISEGLNFKQWTEKYLNAPPDAKEVYNRVRVDVLDLCIQIAKDREKMLEFETAGLTISDRQLIIEKIKEFDSL